MFILEDPGFGTGNYSGVSNCRKLEDQSLCRGWCKEDGITACFASSGSFEFKYLDTERLIQTPIGCGQT